MEYPRQEFADAREKACQGALCFVYRFSLGRYDRMLPSETRVALLRKRSIPKTELVVSIILHVEKFWTLEGGVYFGSFRDMPIKRKKSS